MENNNIIKKINNLYKDICLNDFFLSAKEDYLNIDVNDAVYVDIATENIFKILNDEIVLNLDKKKASILSSGDGKMLLMLNNIYKFEEIIGVENIYEFFYLSNVKKIEINDENSNLIKIYNNSLLSAKIFDKELIIINYNNSNHYFNIMLENKIIDEAKKDSIIIKMMLPFKQNISMKLLKVKKIKDHNSDVIAFYYKKL